MTEMEWLKQESGLTDEEMKAMEAVAGVGKFKAFLVKAVAANEQAKADKLAAENERLALEKRYNEEFIPEMRKVTQDSLRAQGEAARMKAELEAAKQYGIVPEDEKKTTTPTEVRAPGSPNPDAYKDDIARLSGSLSRSIITLNDLNAEHHKLFGSPLANSQELVDIVTREHQIGHKDFTLRKAWEQKYNVESKRAEVAAADQKKHDDEVASKALKEYREKHGDNPHTISGKPSRFSTYKESDSGKNEPWKVPAGMKKASQQPWRDVAKKKLSDAVQ